MRFPCQGACITKPQQQKWLMHDEGGDNGAVVTDYEAVLQKAEQHEFVFYSCKSWNHL